VKVLWIGARLCCALHDDATHAIKFPHAAAVPQRVAAFATKKEGHGSGVR
jgi:hypothetical protein